MLESFLITGRETLEASLVVGIVLATLDKTHKHEYKRTVWWGVLAGIAASILTAVLFTFVAGGFEGRAEEIFEGVTMLIGAVLLTTMILWMSKQRHIAREIEEKVGDALHVHDVFASKMMLFSLVFIAIIREGVETVIFLNAINYASGISLIAGLIGVLAAIILGYLCFVSFSKITLSKVFMVSSILLIFFAAGLVAHSVHEFEEAGVIAASAQLFDINHIINEDGVVGELLSGFFGYNGNPSLVETIAYFAYLTPALFFFLWRKPTRTATEL